MNKLIYALILGIALIGLSGCTSDPSGDFWAIFQFRPMHKTSGTCESLNTLKGEWKYIGLHP
ncbi:MAG: hypothetical protein ABIA76_01490 [Candidatus Diapherotrites archaeon]